ncbi:Chromosome initiation inhibitor [Klebsiella pneumoniae subsp. rhinoscleromatis]|nr:Chromosome initiation inhibitor [Klebsiella pneumoniae subsp. rhinoscleromatis]
MQLARQGTTCCMIPHLQIEKELNSGELIDLTPGLFQRRMLYWHRFAPGKPHDAPGDRCAH